MNKEPRELENWMTTWQANIENPQIQSNFQNQIVRRRWFDYWSIAGLTLVAIFLIHKAFAKPSLFVFASASFFLLYFVSFGFRIWRRMNLEVTALPESSTQYLKILDQNLKLREKENRWEQKTIVPTVVAATFIVLWRIDLGVDKLPVTTMLGIVIPTMSYALYSAFIRVPQKLRTERRNLESVGLSSVEGS